MAEIRWNEVSIIPVAQCTTRNRQLDVYKRKRPELFSGLLTPHDAIPESSPADLQLPNSLGLSHSLSNQSIRLKVAGMADLWYDQLRIEVKYRVLWECGSDHAFTSPMPPLPNTTSYQLIAY